MRVWNRNAPMSTKNIVLDKYKNEFKKNSITLNNPNLLNWKLPLIDFDQTFSFKKISVTVTSKTIRLMFSNLISPSCIEFCPEKSILIRIFLIRKSLIQPNAALKTIAVTFFSTNLLSYVLFLIKKSILINYEYWNYYTRKLLLRLNSTSKNIGMTLF